MEFSVTAMEEEGLASRKRAVKGSTCEYQPQTSYQKLQNLQIQNTAAQQITLTPVQTLTLGQVAAGGALSSTPVSLSTGQLPNLQTVTVNSIDSTGIQLHPGENADSPAGESS